MIAGHIDTDGAVGTEVGDKHASMQIKVAPDVAKILTRCQFVSAAMPVLVEVQELAAQERSCQFGDALVSYRR